jgi:hypothetical protein
MNASNNGSTADIFHLRDTPEFVAVVSADGFSTLCL